MSDSVDRPLQGGVKFNWQLRETLRACVDQSYKTMTGDIFSGKRLNWLFDQRFFFVRSIRNDLRRVACTDQADYSLDLPGHKVAALAWLVATHLAAEAGAAHQLGRACRVDTNQLYAILAKLVIAGPKTGPFSVQLAIDQAFDTVKQKLEKGNPEL
jgi:hypothetical protein